MTDYGVSVNGFVIKTQAVIIAELQARLRATFGNNVNLDERSVFGQLIGIWSEREALIWELQQAVYASAYPSGAEGVSVDNILALNNMRRLGARPSVTNPVIVPRGDGVSLYGLALYGTPGTRVPKGSVVRDTSTPPISFTLDADVVIGPAVNGEQAIILSDVPDAGAYTLNAVSYRTGTTMQAHIGALALPEFAHITFTGTLTTGHYYVMLEDHLLGPFTTMSATDIQVAAQAIPGYESALCFHEDDIDSHPIRLQLVPAPPVRPKFNPIQIDWSADVTTGAYSLLIGGALTIGPFTSLAAAPIQAALHALGGDYRSAFVYTDAGAHKQWFNWGRISPAPSLAVTPNTTGATASVHSSNTTGVTFTVQDSIQSHLGGMLDSDGVRPYTDVAVSSLFVVEFGSNDPAAGQPSSGARAIPLMSVTGNSLTVGGALVTPQVAQYAEGAPARGIGSATCTATGPNAVAAGRLTVIGSPLDGWTGVGNDLDVIPGTNAETDLEALTRRETLLNAAATGPLASIVAAVRKVPGVTTATAFENTTDAALQRVHFAGPPTTGTWQLGVPSIGVNTTAINYDGGAADVQAALNAIPGLEAVVVAGSSLYDFVVDFGGALGGQAQPLLQVWNNSTDVSITVAFGRPPKSVEVQVLGGAPLDIAKAIYSKLAAGVQAYGAPAQVTLAALTAGEVVVSVTDAGGIEAGHAVAGVGISPGTTVVEVAGTDVTLSAPAMVTDASAELAFSNRVWVADADGNLTPIAFTRPTPVLVYVSVALVTDTYRIPGNSSSGVNPQAKFQPAYLSAVQADILAIGSTIPPGGLIVGRGTDGLVGAFNNISGIVDYTLRFGLTPSPSGDSPIQLLPDQVPVFQLGAIAVSYS